MRFQVESAPRGRLEGGQRSLRKSAGFQVELAPFIHRYLEIAGEFDRPVFLSQLGLEKDELERMLSGLDEDYQISRYMHLSHLSDPVAAGSELYRINGFDYSHVSFHSGIQQLV